ncbi:CHASE2 domain-containing protein [Dongia deserti]|uniref:CHASE2 domain-containing protein n=1 Tax=Dongia deserti TaxID=2268030 RepID=UPI0013C42ECB|nr:adenylate/guanylate cyclase domain-containing protein [Dongia deserti]
MKIGWDLAVGAAILIGALALRAVDPLPLQQLRNLTFDSYQRLKPRVYDPSVSVVIAAIDEKSLDTFGQWPWSRITLARITDRLTEMGAAAIAFDVLFAEADRTSPAAIAQNLPADPQYGPVRAQLATLPDPDAEFAAALARSPSVLAFVYSDDAQLKGRPPIDYRYSIATIGPEGSNVAATTLVRGGPYAVLPLPQLMKSAQGLGEVQAGDPDPDGVVRRVPLVVTVGDKLFNTLAGDALRVGVGGQTAQVKLSSDGQIEKMRIGEAIIPVNQRGELLLFDTGLEPSRRVSLGDLFEPDFDPARIAGHIVLIGATAAAFQDLRTTPLAPYMPGVEIHAQILEQVLAGQFLTRPYDADEVEQYYLGAFGLVLLAFLYRRSAIAGAFVLVGAIAVTIGASWWQFVQNGYLFDPIYPALAATAMFGSGTLINYLRTEHEKRQVRLQFAQYLSPILVDRLSEHPEQLKLGGELRELTLMFCDIRGFTKISEALDPQALTQLMNAFLTPMTKIIQAHDGTIDKYIGDCIMAFWNAPMDVPSHAEKSILAALNMRAGLEQLNAAMAAMAGEDGPAVEIKIGIGLNSGTGCVGNMGSEQRFNYTVLGDAVNIASRLEALSPAYGIDLVIGQETAESASGLALLELDRVRVKGKVLPVRIFTCVGDRTVAATPPFRALHEAQDRLLAHYRAKEWDQAEAALGECRSLAPEFLHGFYDLYARRIVEYRLSPPPADWDGVYEAKTKAG